MTKAVATTAAFGAPAAAPWWLRGFALDLRSLMLFRVAIGICCLVNILLRLPTLEAFYTDAGVLPREALVRTRDPLLSLHLVSGEWALQMLLALVGVGFALCLITGYRARLSAVMSWVFVTSMQARNPLLAHGGDQVLRTILFWAMFLPLNGRQVRDDQEVHPLTHLSPASVALVLQTCAVYWFAFAEKMDPIWLTERSAVYYALHLDMFATPLGASLRDVGELTRLLTVGTMALEFLGPFLAILPIWTAPARLLAVVMFIGFHAGLALTMHLGTFPWICIAAWLALVPSTMWTWGGFPRWLEGGPCRASGPLSGLAVVVAILFVALNLLAPTLRPEHPNQASAPERALQLLGWTQRWAMFAPHPTSVDGWHVAEGLTQSGRRVDALNGGAPTLDKPPDVFAYHQDTRWLGYLYLLRDPREEPLRRPFAEYLCRSWEHLGEPLDSVSLAFVLEITPPPGFPSTRPEKQVLWRQACP